MVQIEQDRIKFRHFSKRIQAMIDGSHLAAAAKTDPLEDAIDPRHVLARVFLEPKAIESLRALAPLSLITNRFLRYSFPRARQNIARIGYDADAGTACLDRDTA